MVWSLIRREKLVNVLVFVIFVPNESTCDDENKTIDVFIESHSERSSMRSCLTFIFLAFEVMVKFPYSFMFIRKRSYTISLSIRNAVYWSLYSSIFICRALSCANCRNTQNFSMFVVKFYMLTRWLSVRLSTINSAS